MSLVKSPTLTPALLAAKRRNAQTSTGPRTARGKAQSRLNALQRGERSPAYRQLWDALLCAPPCSVDRTVSAVLTPDVARHPLFAEAIAMFREAEGRVAASYRLRGGQGVAGRRRVAPKPAGSLRRRHSGGRLGKRPRPGTGQQKRCSITTIKASMLLKTHNNMTKCQGNNRTYDAIERTTGRQLVPIRSPASPFW